MHVPPFAATVAPAVQVVPAVRIVNLSGVADWFVSVTGVVAASVRAPLPVLVTVIVPVFVVRVAGVLTSDAGDPENPTIACVPLPVRAKF